MTTLALVLARAGSKRIPHKNIKPFCGKPLLEYSLESALNTDCFSEVMVSTDSEEIASISLSAGAKVPFLRSPGNSNDYATTMDVLKEVISCYRQLGRSFDYFCCIYPAAVLISPEIFQSANSKLISGGEDFLATIVPFGYPIQRALSLNNGKISMLDKTRFNTRSQDLTTFYHDAGQFYMGKVSSLEEYNSFWEGQVTGYEINPMICQDIDNPSDWEIAEFKYKLFTYKL